MQTLRVKRAAFMLSECLVNHFPYLEHLDMQYSDYDDYKKNDGYTKIMNAFFELNSQLKHIDIYSNIVTAST